MNFSGTNKYSTHGDGNFSPDDFGGLGRNVIFENGVLVFHAENISIGDNVYVGHNAILKAYYKNEMIIGSDTWIGQGCFFHSAGGIKIGRAVGIGPGVKILASAHDDRIMEIPVMHNDLKFAPVKIGDGADIGVGSIILPGVKIGQGAIIGAGSVVTRDVLDYAVVAGTPAKLMRMRKESVLV
ncbi:MAG: acyltransferase [candidate division Zixibacteria bacterium]